MAEFEAIGKALQIDDKVLKNLDEVDKRINKIATDSEKMAAVFQSAMKKMDGSALTLLNRLNAMQSVINKLDISKFAQGVQNVGRGTTQVEQFAAAIAKAAAAINKYNVENRKRADVDNSKQIAQLNKEIEAMRKRTQQLEDYINKQRQANQGGRRRSGSSSSSTNSDTKALNAYNRAMAASEALVTQRINKIAKLRNAEEQLRAASGNYATQLNRINQEIARLNRLNEGQVDSYGRVIRSQRNLMNTSQQLTRQLALLFSVSQIQGYINKLIEVRGEFELQQTALSSILQSKDEADALFGQITELAVRSPYTIKELTTYTKSLAAYQVEYENLYDTLKMLADVSSGLGVDMQRLILAFGQVKAANFLRGCLGYGTPVMLYDGTIKQVQDIVVGDVLINEKGEPVNVLELIRGRETMFLVEQVSGHNRTSYRVNRNHILTLWNVQEQRLEDVYVYDYLKNTEAYLGLRIVDGKKVYYDIEVTKDRIDDYYGFVLDGNKRFRLGDGTITHNTETRQFTEAGINMLGELSKYYSELEGRIVSVTEVQDRQFKRMISFQDVEEVFKRLTSAGGMFYNMQEKQAETLRGQMMNFQDQIDLMLNDIGKSNQSTISTIISLAKSVIENWRTIAQVMEPIATILVGYLILTRGWSALASRIPNLWRNIGVALEQVKLSLTAAGRAQQGFNKAAATNAWLAIGAVVATVIWEVVNAIQAANKEQNELNKALSEGYDNAVTMSTNYKRLANTVADATASYEGQEKALEELKRTYGDILPQHYLEADAIRAMKGNYDEATAAIYNYIQAKTQEKQLQIIAENEGADLADSRQDLAKEIQHMAKFFNSYNMSLSESNSIINKLSEDIKSGIVKNSTDAVNRFKELYKISVGIELPSGFAPSELREYYETFVELEKRKEEVLSQSNTAFADSITRDLQERRKVYEREIKEMRSLLNTISHQGEVGEDGALITQKQVDDAKNRLIEITSAWGYEASKIRELTGSAFEIRQTSIDLNKAAIQTLMKEVQNTVFEEGQEGSVLKFLEDLQKEVDSMDATPFQNYVSDIVKAAAVANNVSLDGVMNAFVNAGETVEEYRKRLKGIIDQLKQDLTDYSVSPHLVARWTPEDAINEANKLKVYQAALARVTPTETKGKGGTKGESSIIKELREQIRLIQSAQRAYEEYRKVYTEEESNKRVAEDFERAFANVNLSTDMTFDTEGVITALEELWKKFGEDGQKIIDEVLAPLRKEQVISVRSDEVDNLKNKFDELLGNYEITIQLDDFGTNKGIIAEALNIDTTSLSDLREFYKNNLELMESYGNQGIKLSEEMNKQIAELEKKQLEERTKEYAKYLKNSLSERASIILEYRQLLEGLEATNLSDSAKSNIRMNLSEQTQQKLDKLDWEDFKSSAFYIELFEDLDRASTNTLRYMQEKLKNIKSELNDLDPTNLKEIIEALNELEEEANSRNPFKTLVDNAKEFANYLKQRKTLEEQLKEGEENRENIGSVITAQELAVEEAKKNYEEQKKIYGEYSQQADLAKKNLQVQEQQLENYKKEGELIDDNNEKIREQYNNLKGGAEAFAAAMKDVAEILSFIGNSIGDIGSSLENMLGDKFSDGLRDAFSSAEEIMGSLGQTASGASNLAMGLINNNPMQIAQGAIGTVTGLFNTIGSIFKIGDKKKERQIQRELELVENLQNKYEDLEKAIDDAYSLDTYKQANDAAKQNLENQKKHLQEAINLENDKKDSDSDRIKEWQQQIKDINEQLDELAEQAFNTFTGYVLSDLNSAADEFVDAWLEAFKAVGDGLTGLEDSFEDMLVTIVKRQAALGIIGPYMKNIQDELKKYVNENDKYFTTSDAEKFADYVYSLAPQMSEDLKTFFKPFIDRGLDLVDSEDNLSGLQQGIQSITEETAQALEALLNSIRFFSSDSNTQLRNIYNYLLNPAQENPFLVEMKNHTRLLNSIATTLVSMTMISQTGRRGLRVYIS